MKKILNKVQKPMAALFLLGGLLFSSCENESVKPLNQDFSGKELMEGLYFMSGNAVDLIEPLNKVQLKSILNEVENNKMKLKISAFLDDFEQAYPGSFDSFKNQITSGNHALIGNAINSNAKALIDFIIKEHTKTLHQSEVPLPSLIGKNIGSVGNGQEPTTNSDIVDYFKGLDAQLGQRIQSGNTNQAAAQATSVVVQHTEVVIHDGVIVEGPADICWILSFKNGVDFESVFMQVWQNRDGAETNAAGKTTLMREQLINSIALNWKDL